MSHRIISLLIYASCLGCVLATAQQTERVRDDSLGVFRQLLLMPAPTPRTNEGMADEATRKQQLKYYLKDSAPPDNAPLEDLLAYWGRWSVASGSNHPAPSETVRQQLFEAAEANPEILARLLPVLSDTPEAAERIKRLYDASQNAAEVDEDWQKSVREWLMLNSKYFLDDLLALAQKAKDKECYVEQEAALKALAKIDWPGAEPLLKSLVSGSQPHVAALSLALLYRHAEAAATGDAERYRAQLQIVASDREAPASARDEAIEALSLTDWPGRDDWYLSLFTDETLVEPTVANCLLSPLTTLFDQSPDKWIPVMTRLVESKDRAVQQGAASCLVRYSTSHPRRDAVLPVLRWLSDPDWLKINDSQRIMFVEALNKLDVPESVPGLIWMVENQELSHGWVVRSLARYKDPRIVPALKKALAQAKGTGDREYLIEGLLASGGISEAEQVDALVDYATQISTPEGRAELDRIIGYGAGLPPLSVSLGMYLAQLKVVPESLAAEVLARVRFLREGNPAVSRSLLELTRGWYVRQVDLDTLRRIAAHEADAATITHALKQREMLRESVGPELGVLAGERGTAQGVAAVLLADRSLAEGILGSADSSAKIALLACARLVQMPLNVMQVGLLLRSRKPELALAAERYLLADDSPAARGLLWARHRDEAFITGWRESLELMRGISFNTMGKIEEKLRAELFTKEGAPVEIFALLRNEEHPLYVVRVYTDRAVATYYEDASRYRERPLTSEELAQFKSFITTNRLTESGPLVEYCYEDCWAAEFLSLTPAAGRRLFSYLSGSEWKIVFDGFDSVGSGEGVRIHYYLENEIKGLEVLYVGEEALSLNDVWQHGADLRVLVEREPTPEELEQQEEEETSAVAAVEDEEAEEARSAERRRREAALAGARLSWRALTNGKPGAVLPQPEAYLTIDESKFNVDDELFPAHLNEHLAQLSGGDFLILAADFGTGGLWRQDAGRKAARISGEGTYNNPLVTPDRKWVVAAKSDTNGGAANYVVRFNLQTGREYRVKIPVAEVLEPIAYVAAHGKVLLRRARDGYARVSKPVGPEAPEFYLLDAATGQAQLVTGEFTPLQQHGKRFLQPTGKPNEYWAATPTSAKNQTTVGRYNTRDFSFQPVMVVPQLSFDSTQMWVDETGMKLYVVYEGQLLRLPLRFGI